MKVWILMGDTGPDWEPDIAICGVFATEVSALAAKYEKETAYPEYRYWIEEYEVE